MSRDKKYKKRNRKFQIPKKEGEFSKEEIMKQIKIAAERTPSKYYTGEPCAKPGTVNDFFASEVYKFMMDHCNPNNVDKHMFLGSYELEKEAMIMTAKLLGLKNTTKAGGFFLSGGTESTNQALWTYRNKYYNKQDLDIRKEGLEGIKPKVLAPLDAHFCILKSMDMFGLGTDNLVSYNLKPDFTIDFKDLQQKIEFEYSQGTEFMLHLIVVGDTVKGKVHDVATIDEIVSEVSDKYNKPIPPIVVDAAAQYLFLSLMKDSNSYDLEIPKWNFEVDNVKAIICDPHKNQIPYNTGLIIFKDASDIKFTNLKTPYLSLDMLKCVNTLTDEERKLSQIMATIPTSRGGYGPAATWAYYMLYGEEGIRKKKEHIWKVTRTLQHLIETSDNYELVCEPQTANIVFKLNNNFLPEDNHKVYKSINNSEHHNFYIGHDENGLALSTEDKSKSNYVLYANIMDHNSIEGMINLMYELELELMFRK